MEGTSRHTLKLTGEETFDVTGVAGGLKPRMQLTLTIHRPDGKSEQLPVLCRIDTADEVEYYRTGGILPYVLRSLMQRSDERRGRTECVSTGRSRWSPYH